jgi:8-oxo-dGTP diphosphatase
VVGPEGVLLVRNRRRNGRHDWSPPGGVIDAGESLIEGLTREVHEETGITVTEWRGPAYVIQAHAPDMGWELTVEAHVAVAYTGEIRVDDPDGIVVEARFVEPAECAAHLVANQRWVSEPLTEWLAERWDEPRRYGYQVVGAPPAELTVTRTFQPG